MRILFDQRTPAGFDVLVTIHQNLRYQQNLSGRKLADAALSTTDWRRIRRHGSYVAGIIESATPGAYLEINVPQ